MSRSLKIFVSPEQQRELAHETLLLERYDAFALAEVSDAKAKRLAGQYLTEDITNQYRLLLGGHSVDTSRPRIDASGRTRPHPAYRGTPRLTRGPHHYVVQFVGPIKPSWLRSVRRLGAEVRAPYGDFTYIVRANATTAARIAEQRYVRWIGHLPHTARIAKSLREALAGTRAVAAPPRTRMVEDTFTVEFFGTDDARRGAATARRLGVQVVASDPTGKVLVVRSTSSRTAQRREITALSRVHGVRNIRQRALKRPSNDVATGIMGTTRSTATSGLGLSGSGEIVGVCDTGLDTGDLDDLHPDFGTRVIAIKSYPIAPEWSRDIRNPGGDDGSGDYDSGHGTHVAGSFVGNGSGSRAVSGPPIRGLAYRAQLVFQAIEQEVEWRDPADRREYGRYGLFGLPSDLGPLFRYAYSRGARIHSNSWGGGDAGVYDEQCQQLDQFVWDHQDFCVVVAAGNDGTDKDGDGTINLTSVTSPGTAKNCLTVGACENRRLKFNGQRYGDWWPDDYPAAPYRADPMANDPDQVVAFSSRGPTADGRTKPDVIAPGTFILSTRSTMIAENNTAWESYPPSGLYFYMGGTSMATPLTAGAVALVRQFLRTQARIPQPSSALLKAVLLAGATRLAGYAPAGSILDPHQGYGRVNLDAILAPRAPLRASFDDAGPPLGTGQARTSTIPVTSSGSPLRIALAYTDYPGPTLVNNLNLIVTAPNGAQYAGNQAVGAQPALDTTNNTEVVHVDRAGAGGWRIDVVGSNVPNGPQPYALVTLGCTAAGAQPQGRSQRPARSRWRQRSRR